MSFESRDNIEWESHLRILLYHCTRKNYCFIVVAFSKKPLFCKMTFIAYDISN